jgi:hypothetical protein
MNGIEAMATVDDRPRELVIRARRHDLGPGTTFRFVPPVAR